MPIKRGDIFYADLDPVVGSEQGGTRPIIVIQNNRGNHYSPTVIVAAITGQKTKTMIPTHCCLPQEISGLAAPSTVLLEQIRSIDKSRLREYVGRVEKEDMLDIDRCLLVSLDLFQQ